MYLVIVWTAGKETASPDVFGPFLEEMNALDAAEKAVSAWGWPCTVLEMRDAGELRELPCVLRPVTKLREYRDGA